MEAGDEDAGVDAAGDGRVEGDGGDDGDAEHVGHVTLGQGPVGFGDDDHAVVGDAAADQGGEGDVAGAPEHGAALDASVGVRTPAENP